MVFLIAQLIVNFISICVIGYWLKNAFTSTGKDIANNRKYIIILMSSAIVFAAIITNAQLVLRLWSKI